MVSMLILNKKLYSFTCFIFLTSIVFSQPTNSNFYNKLLEDFALPGLSIALIQEGKLDFLGHYGVSANDTKAPIKTNTVFGAASLSKPVFAYAVMKLADQGKINLDTPLHYYLKNEDLESDPRYRQITARMILSHSSGLPNWRNGELKLVADPGTKFQYSGEGFVYLGKVIEKILDQPINKIIEELVFKPLGMNHSSFVWEDRFAGNFASPHDYTGTPKPNWRPQKAVVASSLYTCASDYAKYLSVMLQEQGLPKETFAEIRNSQIEISPSLSWGLGWGIQKTTQSKYLWQWGDNGTYKAFTMIYPQEKKGMVFFANSYKGLRILPTLVAHLFKDSIPNFKMLENSRRTRADEKLILSILKYGFEKGSQDFLLPNGQFDDQLINESQLNSVAMQLKWRQRYTDEKNVLAAVAHTFPKSFKAQKVYAAHCIKHGHTEEGIQYYKKAQRLQPQNKKIAQTLHLLTAKELSGNTTFVFKDYFWASSVTVCGSFNDWDSSQTPMLKKKGVWTTSIQLPPGTYSYYFVVNGYPVMDPNNKQINMENGQVSAILEVK